MIINRAIMTENTLAIGFKTIKFQSQIYREETMRLLGFLLFMSLILFFSSCTLEISDPLDNVYSGITETGPNDPTHTGAVDSNDWLLKINGKDPLDPGKMPVEFVFCAYPNPTDDFITFQYEVASKSSVVIFISDKPGSIIDTLVNETRSTGYHQMVYDVRGLKSGIYRAFFIAVPDDGTRYTSFGDFRKR